MILIQTICYPLMVIFHYFKFEVVVRNVYEYGVPQLLEGIQNRKLIQHVPYEWLSSFMKWLRNLFQDLKSVSDDIQMCQLCLGIVAISHLPDNFFLSHMKFTVWLFWNTYHKQSKGVWLLSVYIAAWRSSERSYLISPHLTSPHPTSFHFTSFTSPHFNLPHITSLHFSSPHLASLHIASLYLT